MPPKLTHFLALPLITTTSKPQLITSLSKLHSEVTNPSRSPKTIIPPTAIRPLGTLHLTLGVMSLLIPSRIEDAVSLLQSLDLRNMLKECLNSTAKGELRVTLKGLQCMGRDPTKATILYAPPVDEDGVLRAFCLRLRKVFMEKGFLVEEGRELLVHATVVRMGRRETVDARDHLMFFEEKVWMEDVRIERAAILRMGAKKVEGGEEYVIESEVGMP